MEKWKKRAVELISKLVIGEDTNPSVVPYVPQKTKTLRKDKTKYFKRTRPEKRGVSPARLYTMLCELEAERRANVHNILVLCSGKVICECSHPGYSTRMPHLSHSLSKTVTGLAVGMLVDDGKLKLDDKVTDFFPDYEYEDKRFSAMTVEHLLRMSSGVAFAEIGSATDDDWFNAFFSSELKYAPGDGFSYNSMNSYLLSAIITKVTGKSLTDFLDERLFSPLGIDNYYWEKSPKGIVKGGWGLFMSAESWAKIGYMTLQGGVLEGKRIISAEWLASALSTKSVSDGSLGDFNYGYHVWVGRENGEYLFNGMFGQNVWVCPKNDIVVVVNSGNNELFQRSPTLGIIRKYLSGDIRDSGCANFYMALLDKQQHFFENRHWIRPKRKIGFFCRIGLITDRTVADEWRVLEGEYKFRRNNVSILPIFVRLMQNNLESSLDALSVHTDPKGALTLTFVEGGKEYKIPVGIYDFITSEHDFNGEKYLISAIGEAIEDEDRNPVFKVELLMPEMPNVRIIKITKTAEGGIFVRMSENPDKRIVDSYLESSVFSSSMVMMAMGVMKKRLGNNFLTEGLDLIFSPSLVGISVNNPNFAELMADENERAERSSEKYKSVSSLLKNFIKDDDESRDKKSPFSAIGDLLKRRRAALAKSAEVVVLPEEVDEVILSLPEPIEENEPAAESKSVAETSEI